MSVIVDATFRSDERLNTPTLTPMHVYRVGVSGRRGVAGHGLRSGRPKLQGWLD